jgi:type II secretory pathway component PulM
MGTAAPPVATTATAPLATPATIPTAEAAEMLPMAETMGATMRMSAGNVRVARATNTIPVISPVMSAELVTERIAAP